METVLLEKGFKVKIAAHADVIVCGAGPAGVCAAIAAGRAGASVCLIENGGCLGGTWTAGLLGWIIDGSNKTGILQEIKQEIFHRGASDTPVEAYSYPFDIETMKLLLEELCLAAKVRIRLHTRVCNVIKDGQGRIAAVVTESKSGREAWSGKVFIDATGDGDVAAQAGCRFTVGHPENKLTQPMSLLALLTGLELEQVKDYLMGYAGWDDSTRRLREDMQSGGVNPSYSGASLFLLSDGLYYMMANHQYKKSALNADDVTEATIAARREVNAQVAALRFLGGRWKNLRLVATAEHIGTREGRRIKGLYEVTVDDIANGVKHADGICEVTFGIDVHALDPARNKGIEKAKHEVKAYDIPLRSLISADVSNLMMAGRCVSGDFFAHASYRVTGNAAVLGEAAGVTAAIAVRKKLNTVEIDAGEVKRLMS